MKKNDLSKKGYVFPQMGFENRSASKEYSKFKNDFEFQLLQSVSLNPDNNFIVHPFLPPDKSLKHFIKFGQIDRKGLRAIMVKNFVSNRIEILVTEFIYPPSFIKVKEQFNELNIDPELSIGQVLCFVKYNAQYLSKAYLNLFFLKNDLLRNYLLGVSYSSNQNISDHGCFKISMLKQMTDMESISHWKPRFIIANNCLNKF